MPDEQDEALGRLARVLTGDERLAAELLGEVTVLARRPRGPGGEGDEDRRALLVQRVLRRRRPAPVGQAVQDEEAAPAPPDVTGRLARLDPLGRTLLVLRHAEHVTLAELARLTDRSPAAVARALEQAELRAEVAPYEIEQLLWQTAAPAPGLLREAERRAAAHRRRRRTRVVLAAVAAAALLTAGTVLPGVLREQPYVRAYGEWTSTAQLAPQSRFRFQGRELTADEEVLSVTAAAEPDLTCSITVTTDTKRVPVPAGRKATVADRPARFVAASLVTDAGLWWSVGTRTTALANCGDEAEDQTLLDLARQLRFAPVPVRVPFDLRGLPPEDEVHTYLDYLGTSGVLVTPRGSDEQSPDAVFVGVIAETSAGAVSGRRVDVMGSPGRLADDEDEATVCWPSGSHTVCAGMNQATSTVSRSQRSLRTARVLRTARAVRLADLDQPSTWFDARVVLPR